MYCIPKPRFISYNKTYIYTVCHNIELYRIPKPRFIQNTNNLIQKPRFISHTKT
jgi:aspartyl/asparaginyl beta-hydroxylase (cupin superfamily)